MGLGFNDASKESCQTNLTRGPGSSIMLVVGGAAESLEARPGDMSLVINTRKGFVKVALRTGASLVPVLSFGETDVFESVQNGTLHKLQRALQKRMGFALPLLYGRAVGGGLMQLLGVDIGILPFRMPIHSVVGRPIDCERCADPTQEMIDAKHAEYVKELERLYAENHREYEEDRAFRLEQMTKHAAGKRLLYNPKVSIATPVQKLNIVR